MPPRGLATSVSAAKMLQKHQQTFQAANNIKPPKSTVRLVLPVKGKKAAATASLPCKKAGASRAARPSFAPHPLRQGPLRHASPTDCLEFLTVAAAPKPAFFDLNDSGYAMSKQTSLELARSILVFKVPTTHISARPPPATPAASGRRARAA